MALQDRLAALNSDLAGRRANAQALFAARIGGGIEVSGAHEADLGELVSPAILPGRISGKSQDLP